MPDKKLTDSEIVKALECCVKAPFCGEKTDCPYKGIDDCVKKHTLDALDLINGLQAENERLKAKVNHYNYCYENFVNTPSSRIKAEAYKEFADKMDEKWLCGVLSYAFSDGYAMDNKANIEELSKFLAKKIKELAGD